MLYPQAKVIEAAIYILNHIASPVSLATASCSSRRRISSRSLGNHFNSSSIEVRRALCYLLRESRLGGRFDRHPRLASSGP